MTHRVNGGRSDSVQWSDLIAKYQHRQMLCLQFGKTLWREEAWWNLGVPQISCPKVRYGRWQGSSRRGKKVGKVPIKVRNEPCQRALEIVHHSMHCAPIQESISNPSVALHAPCHLFSSSNHSHILLNEAVWGEHSALQNMVKWIYCCSRQHMSSSRANLSKAKLWELW